MATADITGYSTMQEVLDALPWSARGVGYHIGGCSSCGFAPGDRLSDVLAGKNVLNVDCVGPAILDSDKGRVWRICMRKSGEFATLVSPTTCV